jgi:FkbM family methyltransferase
MVLNCLFQSQATGFYVDVGAHHPIHFSNTQFFYANNWCGINIDPRPGIMRQFAKVRPRDINLELGISGSAGVLTYYAFSEPAVNTFDEPTARCHAEQGSYKLVSTTQIPTRTLASVLDEYLPPRRLIDFLSVDVEGLDEEVLRSNNWDAYRPRVVLAEDLTAFTLDQALNSKLARLLGEVGYVAIAKTVHSIVFCDKSRARGSYGVLIA